MEKMHNGLMHIMKQLEIGSTSFQREWKSPRWYEPSIHSGNFFDKGNPNMGTNTTKKYELSQSKIYPTCAFILSKTGHSFQGRYVGLDYVIPCIIMHRRKKSMEQFCPGLLCLFISLARKIGTPNRNWISNILLQLWHEWRYNYKSH